VEEFSIRHLQKSLIVVQLLLGEISNVRISEATEDQVHLAGASVPGTVQQAAAAGVQTVA
jgi:hypothetical protein